jgi:acyl carrier protein
MTKEEVYQFVFKCIDKYANENDIVLDLSEGHKARLYGGSIDSMELVALIVNIEEAVEDFTGKSITLADEKAMSKRTSPFLSVGLLADYVYDLLQNIN